MFTLQRKTANITRRPRNRLWTYFIAGLLLAPCGDAWSQPGAAVFEDVAEQLARYFPTVTGEVVKVENGSLYVSLGARDHLLPGTQLTLLRPQEAAPESGREPAVSRLEEAIGYVIVKQVFETYALAQLLALPDTEARRGDRVRITSGPVALGVLPVGDTTSESFPRGGLTAGLQSALEANGRFRVVAASRLLLWSLEHDTPLENGVSPDLLRRMAQSLRFTYAVVALVKDAGGEPVLDVALLSPQSERLVASGSALLPPP